jgi:hypothetical protein
MCGHYDRSVDPCDDGSKIKSLCAVPQKGATNRFRSGLTGTSSGGWCRHEGCARVKSNKIEGPGRLPPYVILGC